MTSKLGHRLLPESEISVFQRALDELKAGKNWNGLRDFLKDKSELYPDDYYILTELSQAYFLINSPKDALCAAQKAFLLEENDELVIYNLAMALQLNGMYSDAMKYFDMILSKLIDDIAYGNHGEGKKWAKSLHNDSLYMKGVCYMELGNNEEAAYCIRSHIYNRRRGIYSDFSRKQVLRRLNKLQHLT
ncbi:tetratricopeptide repeat protein [uncultured Muribaculum sp.]|uniref:tetratricopeptide repeat protein n=1 Tax=uncultured Muribaculum sp. TaxID=1918613 RepID=UPI0025E8B3EC|nr:tetratricopeptide repeat protein [uncultured Muribaculum sp.]